MSTEKKVRKSANFALECEIEMEKMGDTAWKGVKDGFVSQKKALEYAEEEKICGVMRVVRVVVGYAFGGTEPVYTLKQKSAEKVKRTRKAKTEKTADKVEEKPTDEEIRSARNLHTENPILTFKVGVGQKKESIQVGASSVLSDEEAKSESLKAQERDVDALVE